MNDFYKPLQVSEVLEVLNETLAAAHPAILVEGEVHAFKVNQNKFIFFEVKDENGSLNCFMMLYQLKFPLEDGMKVRIVAEPKITRFGKFSLTVHELQPTGEGSLKKAFQLLKEKLEKEGLFSEDRKRSLPRFPQRIGVVSSQTAAGFQDFTKILNNRWAGLDIILADTPVQGVGAPKYIVEALQTLNALPEPLDVIAIIRGGGSVDDLAAFSSEAVVRAVAGSRVPTIIGVGHDVDSVLADLAADVRAATPSHAAELVVPDKKQIRAATGQDVQRIERQLAEHIAAKHEQAHSSLGSLHQVVNAIFIKKNDTVAALKRTLVQANPSLILKRGYSLVYKAGRIINTANDVIVGEKIDIQLSDGALEGTITHVGQQEG